MRSLLLALLVAAAVATSIAVQQTASAQQQPADTILTNGKIITVDDQFSIAQAVAVRGDRIVAVGSTADITRLAGPATRRIDLRGRAVLPGFIDNHAHFQEEGAYWAHELRFDTITSRKEALEKIRAAAQKVGPGKWVYNYGGWSNDQFIDDKKLFTREELDKVLARQPGVHPGEPCRDLRQQQGDRDDRARKDDRPGDRARCQRTGDWGRPRRGRHCQGRRQVVGCPERRARAGHVG